MSAARPGSWFGGFSSIAALLPLAAATALAAPTHVWEKVEITLQASNNYANPYTDAQVWVDLKGPGFARRCYGFWDGGNQFRVRVLATAPGTWTWRSGSQPVDEGLTGRSGAFDAVSWTATEMQANICRRGNLRATANGHAFEHADGTPFLLLGDTWWATPTFRFPWRDDDAPRPLGPKAGFKDFVRLRRQQEFNCIALIAALPNWANDGHPATLRMADGTFLRSAWREAGTDRAKNMTNEFGQRAFLFPGRVPGFERVFPDLESLNPEYFQTLDRKMDYLNAQGFIPFIEVARRDIGQAWKKFYPWPQSYVRYIQYVWSRYQAHIVLFSPIHFDTPAESIPPEEWNRAAKAVLDQFGPPPFGTLVGNNANPSSLRNWGHVDRAPWLGFHQIGNRRTHDCYAYLTEIFRAKPPLPGLNGEPYYDGMEDAVPGSERAALYCRSAMYGSVLSGGLAGHIYGAGGWQGGLWSGEVEATSRFPVWEVATWHSADQMCHLKSFILSAGHRYQELEPLTDALSPARSGKPNGLTGWAYAARTPGQDLFLLYFEQDCPSATLTGVHINAQYRAQWFNPRTGQWRDAAPNAIKADAEGKLVLPPFPGTPGKSETDWALKLTSTEHPRSITNTVRVAGVVLKWMRGDKETNYRRMEPLIREAAAHGAQLVCTTECFLDGYAIADKSIPLEQYRALGEPIPEGVYFRKLADLAKELKIFLIAGMLEADGERRYNTAALINSHGELVGKYHKQQLEHEAVRNTAGKESPVFETPFGTLGVMVCADRRFSDVVKVFCERGADFLICPSGGMFGPKSNDPILQARSKENGKYIVFVHPAEFLVTSPDGAIVERTLLGDRLLIAPDQIETAADSQRVCYFDVPLGRPSSTSVTPSDVPLWGRFETGITNTRSYANPFEDVTLRATFTRPDNSRVSFWGFHDGDGHGGQRGPVWKLRFMPDQIGRWSFTSSFSDGAPGPSGTFQCVAKGAEPGPLRIDPANRRCWIFADGTHFLARAFTAPELFVAGDERHRRFWVDYFLGAKHRFNLGNANLLNFVGTTEALNWQGTPYRAPDPDRDDQFVAIRGNGLFPFLYSGTRPRFDGGSNVDWLRPSVRCWANVDQVLGELEARRVVWFNHWGMIGWDWSGNGRLLVPPAARKSVLRYWIARLAPYWNLTWNIAGEWDELLQPAELDELGNFIKENDPWQHPLTSHALGTTVDRSWLDFRVQQFAAGTSSDTITNANRAAADFRDKPVFAFETSWEATPGKLTADQVRRGAWGSVMGGAFYLYAECFEPTLTWGDGGAFRFVELMHDFFAALPFWKLRPEPTLVNPESVCLADPGQTYVVYRQRGGTVILDLAGLRSTSRFKAEWFDPRTGARHAAGTVAGGEPRSFTCPDSQDWVLYLDTNDSAHSAAEADFFVSTRGNDQWSGRLSDPREHDGPFASLARARAAVRGLRKTRTPDKTIRVELRGGTYYLDNTLEFGPEDSGTDQAPVVYAAAPGERVVVSGGRRLDGGRWGEANGHKAWVVDTPEAKEGTWRFRQLFVNGTRCPRTRLPKQGEYRIESLPGYTGDFLRSPTRHFVYAPGHIVPTWRNLRDVEVVGLTRWLDNRLPIQSVDSETRTVTFDRASLFALVSSAPWGDSTTTPSVYWVENVFEALDTPGQWHLDRPQGRLYYLPRLGEDMVTAEIIAPRLTQVVRIIGRPGAPAHDLRFEGITFSHTEWQPPADYASSLQAGVEVAGALFFDYAERCAVTGGAIEHIGNCGIEVNVGCADIEISHNRITDIGAGGIRVGHFFSWETDGSGQLTERGKQRKAAMPKGPHSERITVADNVIAHCGRFSPEAAGVFIGDNAHNKIIHNHIYDLFQCAISVGSVQDFGPSQAEGNVIEHNHVHDVGQGMLSDVAGIYTCSTPRSRIRFNRVHDVSRRDYGGWGIYPDQGSHDLLIEKNLVYRCQDGALFAHHNQNITAENNIFALNRGTQIERYGIGGFELTCRRNLIYYGEGTALGTSGIENSGTNVCVFDRNLYWNLSGEPVLFGDKSLVQWQARKQDRYSLIADPLFVNGPQGDFRLRPGSPAQKIGFEPWDLSDVGPRSNLSRTRRKEPPHRSER